MSRTVTFLGLGLLILVAVYLAADYQVDGVKPAAAQAAVSKPGDSRTGAVRVSPASFRFTKPAADRPEEEPAAPISLTASDGTELVGGTSSTSLQAASAAAEKTSRNLFRMV